MLNHLSLGWTSHPFCQQHQQRSPAAPCSYEIHANLHTERFHLPGVGLFLRVIHWTAICALGDFGKQLKSLLSFKRVVLSLKSGGNWQSQYA